MTYPVTDTRVTGYVVTAADWNQLAGNSNDADSRIGTLEGQNLDGRLTTAEGDIGNHETRVGTLETNQGTRGTRGPLYTEVGGLDTRVTTLENSGSTLPIYHFGTWANGTSDINMSAANTYYTVWTVSIPDPGFTYRVKVCAGWPMSWGTSSYGYIRLILGTETDSPFMTLDVGAMPSSWTAFQVPGVLDPVSRVGATTLYVRASSANSTGINRYTSTRNWCQVELVPSA